MTEEEAGFLDSKFPPTQFDFAAVDPPEEDRAGDQAEALRKMQLKAVEFAVSILIDARTDRSRHMRASVGLAILSGDFHIHEIADHFKVSEQRVQQVAEEIAEMATELDA